VISHPALICTPSLLISSNDHSICISYDKIENKWLTINANNVSEKHVDLIALLANKMISDFFAKQAVYLTINVYALTQDVSLIKNILSENKITTLIDKSIQSIFIEGPAIQIDKQALITALFKSSHLNTVNLTLKQLKTDVSVSLPAALYLAVLRRNYDLAKMWLDKNINPNIKVFKKLLSLHTAIRNNDIEMIKLLLSYGARAKAKNYKNQTAFDLIDAVKNKEIFHLLKVSLTIDKTPTIRPTSKANYSRLHCTFKYSSNNTNHFNEIEQSNTENLRPT
jgi:ankyrin repeat protein